MDVIEIILKDVDNGEEISMVLQKSFLEQYEYFKKIFTFGKESNEKKITVVVDDVWIAQDVINMELQCGPDGNIKKYMATSYIKDQYTDWLYNLKVYQTRKFFLMPEDLSFFDKLKIPKDCFEEFLTACNELQINGDKNFYRMVRKNIPKDFAVEKIPLSLIKNILETNVFVLATLTDYKKSVCIWNIESNELIQKISIGLKIDILALSNSAMATLHNRCNKIYIWNPLAGSKTRVIDFFSYMIKCLILSPDGEYIVGGDGIGLIQCWNVHTGELVCQHLTNKHHDKILDITFSNDNKYLACLHFHGIIIYHFDNGNLSIKTSTNHNRQQRIAKITFSLNNENIYFVVVNMILSVWNIETGKFIVDGSNQRVEIPGRILKILNDDRLVFVNINNDLIIKSIDNTKIIKKIETKQAVTGFTFIDRDISQTTKYLNYGSLNKYIICYDVSDKINIHVYNHESGEYIKSFMTDYYSGHVEIFYCGPFFSRMDRKMYKYLVTQMEKN